MASYAEPRRPFVHRGVIVVACFLAGALLGLFYLQLSNDRSVGQTDGDMTGAQPGWVDPISIFQSDRPLLSPGSIVTLEEAASTLGRPVYVPLAMDVAAAPEVWLSAEAGDVGLRYSSGLVLVETAWQPGADPARVYAARAEETGVGAPTTINGHDAFVIQPDEQGPGFPPFSVVLLSIDATQVAMYGTMPLDELIRIAESVQPTSLST